VRKSWAVAVGLVVAAGYLVAFLFFIDPEDLPPFTTWTAMLLAAAVVAQMIGLWLFGELFRQGLAAIGRRVSTWLGFRAALVGATVARLLPAGGAVTPLAMSWTVKSRVPHASGAAIRATALNYGAMLVVTGGGLLLADGMGNWSDRMRVVGAGALVVGGIFLAVGTRLGAVLRRLPRRIADRFRHSTVDLALDPRGHGLVWGRVLAETTVLGFVLVVFDLELGPMQLAAAFGISQLAAGIPGTPGGAGFAEAGLVGGLALFGIGASTALAPVLVFRIVSYWLPAGAGLLAGTTAFLRARASVEPMKVSFDLLDHDGNRVTSADYSGQNLIMFFYPKAMTPGCTTEACDFRDSYDELLEAGYEIVGVSPDAPEDNADFRKKEGLPFPLLSDQDHSLAEELGAWGTKKLYGKEVEGLIRSTFVIGPEGTVEESYRNVKATGHVERLKKDLLG
jgi:thioredoxin-dependent peroxiredoxin